MNNFSKAAKLINTKTGKEVKVGDKVTDFRGDKGILTDVTPQTGMLGHIYMDGSRCYPSVIDCKFVNPPLFVVVRKMEESEDFQTVEVLQRRLFVDEDKANDWCKQLTADFGKGYEVVPLSPE
jgi:hypothetical protein